MKSWTALNINEFILSDMFGIIIVIVTLQSPQRVSPELLLKDFHLFLLLVHDLGQLGHLLPKLRHFRISTNKQLAVRLHLSFLRLAHFAGDVGETCGSPGQILAQPHDDVLLFRDRLLQLNVFLPVGKKTFMS